MSLPYVVDGETPLDSALFNPIIDRANGDAGPLVNMRIGVVNVLDHASAAAAITAATAGDTVIFPPGTYDESTLTIAKALTIQATGAILDGGGLYITATDVTVLGLTVTDAPSFGIRSTASRTVIRNCIVIDSADDGIHINATGVGTIDDCEVSGCLIDRSSLNASTVVGKGIGVVGENDNSRYCNRVRITNNTVLMPDAPTEEVLGIEIWGGCPNSTITGNTVNGGKYGISINESDYSAVMGNTVKNTSLYGMEIADSSYSAISGNSVEDAVTGILISCPGTGGNNLVQGNSVQASTVGIHANSAPGTSISGNMVRVSGNNGMTIQSSSGSTITGNRLDGGGTCDYALWLDTSDKLAISSNVFNDFESGGLVIYAASAVTLTNIVASGNIYPDTPNPYIEALSGGAAIGTNVVIEGDTKP